MSFLYHADDADFRGCKTNQRELKKNRKRFFTNIMTRIADPLQLVLVSVGDATFSNRIDIGIITNFQKETIHSSFVNGSIDAGFSNLQSSIFNRKLVKKKPLSHIAMASCACPLRFAAPPVIKR